MGTLDATRIRWGILGCGRIAGDFALGLRSLPDAELLAVGSREAARAEAFARAVGARRAHGSYEQLVADPELDVVYVATPNSEHRAHCRLALSAGKAVLCEKPFATNAREARDVVALARERRLFCMEALWTRFLPQNVRAEALVRQGEIGEPLAFQADFGIARPPADSRVFRPELGGGALLDLGVYLVAAARAFLGPEQEATGFGSLGPTGVDEQASILLRHAGGRQSLLLASLVGETRAEAVVTGTRGRLRIHRPLYRPHRISIEPVPPPADGPQGQAPPPSPPPPTPAWKRGLQRAYQRFDGLVGPLSPGSRTWFEPAVGNGLHYQAAEVARCLRAGELESPHLPLDETLAVMDVLDRLRAAWGVRFPSDAA